jgi:hypothetical protein
MSPEDDKLQKSESTNGYLLYFFGMNYMIYYKIVNETHSLLEILTYVAYSRKHFIPRDICFYRNIIFLSGSQKQILQVGIELRTFSYFMIFFYL